MKLDYNFDDLLNLPSEQPEEVTPEVKKEEVTEESKIRKNPAKVFPPNKTDKRNNWQLAKCCVSCKYSWWSNNTRRLGKCRYGYMTYPPVNYTTPHPIWEHMDIYSATVCENFEINTNIITVVQEKLHFAVDDKLRLTKIEKNESASMQSDN